MKLAGYDFEGPFFSRDEVKDLPGVYTVLSMRVLDVGYSDRVFQRLRRHDRRELWEEYCGEDHDIVYGVLYEPDPGVRLEIPACAADIGGGAKRMREVQRSSDVRVDPPSDGTPVRSIAARGMPLAAWWSPQLIALALVAGLATVSTQCALARESGRPPPGWSGA